MADALFSAIERYVEAKIDLAVYAVNPAAAPVAEETLLKLLRIAESELRYRCACVHADEEEN